MWLKCVQFKINKSMQWKSWVNLRLSKIMLFNKWKVNHRIEILWRFFLLHLLDEVTIAQACVSHPFIVHTHYYWQSRRYLYIITDYVENGELLSLWLRIRRFPEMIVKIYIAQVAMVLDYLHHKGIIYRDVKMENILLDEHGNIKIIDFGLSKWLGLGQRTTTICGTLQCKQLRMFCIRFCLFV